MLVRVGARRNGSRARAPSAQSRDRKGSGSHSAEEGRRQGCKGAGDCAPQGEKARKQGGKREPPPRTEERPKDTLIHI